jgi:hypothetical protein
MVVKDQAAKQAHQQVGWWAVTRAALVQPQVLPIVHPAAQQHGECFEKTQTRPISRKSGAPCRQRLRHSTGLQKSGKKSHQQVGWWAVTRAALMQPQVLPVVHSVEQQLQHCKCFQTRNFTPSAGWVVGISSQVHQ